MPFTCEILREKTGGVVGQPRVGSEEKFSAKRRGLVMMGARKERECKMEGGSQVVEILNEGLLLVS